MTETSKLALGILRSTGLYSEEAIGRIEGGREANPGMGLVEAVLKFGGVRVQKVTNLEKEVTYSPHWFLAESDLPSRTAAGPSGTFGQIRKRCLFLSAMAPGQGQVSWQVGPGQSFSSTCLLGCCITGPPVHEETCWPGVNTLFPVPPYLPYQ